MVAAPSPTAEPTPFGRAGQRVRDAAMWALAAAGVPFFLIACTLTYYGQLHRSQTGDAYGTIYTAVAIVQSRTIFLDEFLPYIQARAGEQPYMLKTRDDGRVVNGPPLASSLLAVPVVAAFTVAGVDAADFDTWMEAGMLTAALTGAASVALLFVLLTRLTTRRRSALIASTYAWGTLAWGISAQGLWQHGGAALALILTLLFLVDRRYALAGASMLAMIAFRPSTPVIAVFLLPLVGRRLRNWARFGAALVPVVLGLALYNRVAFSSMLEQGYGKAQISDAVTVDDVGNTFAAAATLLVSPGRGLFFYSPVLLFALAGAVIGFRKPLYRWCAIAFLAYPLAIGNLSQWSGNEAFGPRKLTEAIPLLAVLLVPAVDRIVHRPRWLTVFGILLTFSVAVQLLGAAMWPPPTWYSEHDVFAISTWWSLTDNELVAMLREPDVAARFAAMLGLLAGSIALALGATRLLEAARRPRAIAGDPAAP